METATLQDLRTDWQAACLVCDRLSAAYDAAVVAEHGAIDSGLASRDPQYLVVTRATDAAWAKFAAAVKARNDAFAAWERARAGA